MAKWIYTLKHGKELREAINEQDRMKILDVLEKCWREIHKAFPDVYDEYDLENDLDDIKLQRDNEINHEEEDYDLSEEDLDEQIDGLLDNLYDYCDGARIWVEI